MGTGSGRRSSAPPIAASARMPMPSPANTHIRRRPLSSCKGASGIWGAAIASSKLVGAMNRYPASCQGKWHQQEHRLAYIPAFFRHAAEGKRRGCQNRSGALTRREQPNHSGCLYPGSELEQACRAEQGCEDDGVRSGSEARGKIPANCLVAGLLDLYRTLI